VDPWFETLSVFLVAVTCVFLGYKAGGLTSPWWWYVVAAPMLMLALLATAACTSLFDGVGPLLFITAGRARYVILAAAITLGLTTPLSRLPYRVERIAVSAIMVFFVGFFAILPFLAPALVKGDLSRLETRVDANGLCYQSRSYTCGPAAAVTALARFGVSAEEGQIAMLARTNPFSGTLLWTLHAAIKEHYAQGLNCEFRRFDSAADMRDIGVTLVSIREAAFMDHCVAVLNVSDTAVTVADPIIGLEVIPIDYFEEIWRRCGIVLNSNASGSM
jgi:uncharacterized protein